MKVLTVYAHYNPRSFCHAVLERFTTGLEDAGHEVEVVDLYATHFDPVFTSRDMAAYVHEDMPADILESMNLAERAIAEAGGPVRRAVARRWLRGKTPAEVARIIRTHGPKDAAEQREKVMAADGLAFISPVIWLHYPAILKGWFERVFSYGTAYALDRDGWNGHASGRIPLLHHEKALIINTTLFSEEDYEADWGQPMARIMDDWALRYPGVKHVEHVYFYEAAIADPETLAGYLERAYLLGRDFAEVGADPARPSPLASHAA